MASEQKRGQAEWHSDDESESEDEDASSLGDGDSSSEEGGAPPPANGQPRRNPSRLSDDDDGDDDDDDDESSGESDFEAGNFAASATGSRAQQQRQQPSNLDLREVQNQPYDARVELEGSFSDESVDTNAQTPTPKVREAQFTADRGDSPPRSVATPRAARGDGALSESEEIPGGTAATAASTAAAAAEVAAAAAATERNPQAGVKLEAAGASMQEAARRADKASLPSDNDDDDDDDEDESSASRSPTRGSGSGGGFVGFDPRDFDKLDVSSEVKELFQYIGRYKPHDIELETKLRCFVPDYIPAIGEMDAFVKMPRPDGKPDDLGLRVLDEPAGAQSDATVLDLQLRAMSKKAVRNPTVVRSIEHANKDRKAVQAWIDSIKDLHRSKPPPQVTYTKQMPEIDDLMQVWPDKVERLLREERLALPPAEIDLDLRDYARVVCAVLDIPVYDNLVEPLHVLFTLYADFRENQHFSQL